jgi:C-terminal processing protease CtpA/Prc
VKNLPAPGWWGGRASGQRFAHSAAIKGEIMKYKKLSLSALLIALLSLTSASCQSSSTSTPLPPAFTVASLPTATATSTPLPPAPAPTSLSPTWTIAPSRTPLPTPTATNPPSGDEQTLANLAALARLYGYVRYFHPSDQAVGMNWKRVAANGVLAASEASGPADLAQKLQDFFQPIAPTLRVFPLEARPPVPDELAPPPDAADLQIVMWRHYGIQSENPDSVYHSDLVREPAPGGAIPAGFHDPRQPFYADLGAGVAALIPLALYADDEGTLPHVTLSSQNSPDQFAFHSSQQTRAASVIIAWNVLQHSYPYFDVVQTDWPQALRDALAGAWQAQDEDAFYETLQRLVARLQDGHGNIFTASDDPYAPGLYLGWVEEQLVVLHAQDEAAESLQVGDVILSIDGQPAAQVIAEAEELISGATPQWKRFKALDTLLIGPHGSLLTLEARREPDELITALLKRTTPAWELWDPRPETITELEPGIFYVNLHMLEYEDFSPALPQLQTATGIIFDLRGYPFAIETLAHLIDEPVTCAQWHVPLITYPDHQNMDFEFSNWQVQPRAPRLTDNVAFLTDGRAISAAETYMGIVEHYQLAAIVGQPTAGTNGNINRVTLPGKYTILWTGMKVLKHDGSQHHGVGIQPTLFVSRTLQGVREGRDEQLERALELLKKPGF